MKILLVGEDDEYLETQKTALKSEEGFSCLSARMYYNFQWKMVEEHQIDAIVLIEDGVRYGKRFMTDFVQQLRMYDSRVPIIFILEEPFASTQFENFFKGKDVKHFLHKTEEKSNLKDLLIQIKKDGKSKD